MPVIILFNLLILALLLQFDMSYSLLRSFSIVGAVQKQFRSSVLCMSSSSTTAIAKKYLLEYKYVDNMTEKRTPYRSKHLELAQKLLASKTLIAGGAFLPAVDGALFIFSGSEDDVKRFVAEDPYVTAGLVPSYTIREWAVAVGGV